MASSLPDTFKSKEVMAASEVLQELFSNLYLQIPTESKNGDQPIKSMLEPYKKLEKELEEVTIVYSATSENVERLQDEYNTLKKQIDEKRTHNSIKSKQKADLEKECNLLSKSKLSSNDVQLVESTKMRYVALKNMTKVRFSFQNSQNGTLDGFAFNDVTKKTKYFYIPKVSSLNEENISEQIMACMEEAVGTQYADIPLQ